MICLASLLIKAFWGEVANTAPLLPVSSVVISECSLLFERFISVAIKVPL